VNTASKITELPALTADLLQSNSCLVDNLFADLTYPKEFKEEAVSLINNQGYSVPEAAKSLGIRTNLLYRWKQQIEGQQQGKSLAEDEREELKRLRKENKLLRIEKDILKKASAFFAKERGVAIFAKACFGHPILSKASSLNSFG
jgi:transposase